MSEFLSVPSRNVVPAAGLSMDQAAMLEFLAIGAHGVRRADATPDDRVLIVGAGPIGMAAAIFALSREAEVSVLDLNNQRLAFCRDVLGVAHAVEARDGVEKHLAKLTDGAFYDVVIDAAGSPAAMEKSFDLVAHAGRYVLLSIVQARIGFVDPEFHKRETTLLSSRNATREDFVTVIAAIKAGKVPTGKLASHRAPLAAAAEAIPVWATQESGTIKALVEV